MRASVQNGKDFEACFAGPRMSLQLKQDVVHEAAPESKFEAPLHVVTDLGHKQSIITHRFKIW